MIPADIEKDFEENVLSVQQLIDQLEEISDKTKKVIFHYKEKVEAFYVSEVQPGRVWIRPMFNEVIWFDGDDSAIPDEEKPDLEDTKIVVALVEDTIHAGHGYCSCCDNIGA